MTRRHEMAHKFVEFMPPELDDGVVYVSIEYATASHKCACGCGRRVVTPFTPTDWTLSYDGKAISLDPSIGNWSFPCQSHYWIRRGRVVWARRMSDLEIQLGRDRDRYLKSVEYGETRDDRRAGLASTSEPSELTGYGHATEKQDCASEAPPDRGARKPRKKKKFRRQ